MTPRKRGLGCTQASPINLNEGKLMNKKLIALAVASAVVAPAALADTSNVNIYGKVNVGVVYDSKYTSGERQLKVDNLATSSRIGFKGEEDLGGGTKAFFQLESGVAPDDASASGWATREGWVGMKFGSSAIALGRGKSAYQLFLEEFDLFDVALTLGLNEVDGNNKGRFNNSAKFTGDYGPVSVAASLALGENKTAKDNSSWDFAGSLKYAAGPVWVGGAVDVEERVGAAATAVDRRNYLLGVGYTMGAVSLGGAFQKAKAEMSTGGAKVQDRNSFLFNAAYAMGQSELQGGLIIARKNNDVKDSEYNHYVFGFKQGLSKRTAVKIELGHIDFKVDGKNDPTTFGVGVMHNF
ncbi:porin [Parachitinimonas caeni]|uniref:Porin n=1 Tax=Parachitinimonas caeni TaxID=3031301 RepID=A0ABT7DXH7_9NEIS|nr:porin [Parachitinimonas caeni]MDK2124776.1 porin [Parachitinimonas caeni]